jgi:signal transduction histidine kinase
MQEDVTERVQAKQAVQQYTERLQILREIDQAILAAQSPEATAQAALSRIRELVPCQWASVAEFDFETREATVLAAHANSETEVRAGARLPLEMFEITEELRQGQVHVVEDILTFPQPPPAVQALLSEGVRSYINVPLIAQGQLTGTLNLGADRPGAFGDEQIEVTRELADQLAIAIQQARLHEEVQQRVQELSAIHETGRRLQELHTPETLAQEIIAVLEQTLSYEYGAVLLVEEATGRLIPFALSDQGRGPAFAEADKGYVASHDVRLGVGITGWVARTGQSVRVGDVRQDPRYHPMRDDIRSELCVPLHVGDQVVGVVNVETTRPNAYTEADRRVLETVAAQMAVAIQNARLYKQIQHYAAELEQRVAERTKELAQANLQLKELDRLKSMFIASMSHELRTPLNSIIGFTGIMLQGMAGEITGEQRKQLTMVKNSAHHLLALINDIIDVSKIEAGKVELAIEEFDLSALAQEVRDSFTVAAEEKGLKLSLDMPERLIIESDKRRVKQVLMNLVGNAVKFTDRGEIEIEVAKREGRAEVSVRDTGIGIREEDMGKLFKPFSQIPVEGAPREGTGLGLYLSRRIANLLGGETEAESEFGKGSKFTFTVPIKKR